MKSMTLVLAMLLSASITFAQGDDYICSKLTKDQGIAGLIVNAEFKTIPEFAEKLNTPTTATSCSRCIDDDVLAYNVDPSALEMKTIYGLTVNRIELFYHPYQKRDSLDSLYIENYTLIGIVIQIDLPKDEKSMEAFQTGLFNDYSPILNSYGITERGERLQWYGDGNCGIRMSTDMSFELKNYEKKGLKTIEWVFASDCGG